MHKTDLKKPKSVSFVSLFEQQRKGHEMKEKKWPNMCSSR